MLSDIEIKKKLPEIDFKTANANRPFRPELQINAASVDLRICSKYYLPERAEVVKLDSDDFGASTIGLFKEKSCNADEYITIKPKSFILGRTYESFNVPEDCSAVTHARSSYARLGLDINSTSQFINPGWSGHMPLIIHNPTNWPVSLKPFDRIVQISFGSITGEIENPYTKQSPSPNYMFDNGGPSKIWINLCRAGLDQFDFKLSSPDKDKIIKFGQRLNQLSLKQFLLLLPKYSQIDTSDELISQFISSQKTEKTIWKVLNPTFTTVLTYTIFWLLNLKSYSAIFIPITAGIVLLLTSLYFNRFESIDTLNKYLDELNND